MASFLPSSSVSISQSKVNECVNTGANMVIKKSWRPRVLIALSRGGLNVALHLQRVLASRHPSFKMVSTLLLDLRGDGFNLYLYHEATGLATQSVERSRYLSILHGNLLLVDAVDRSRRTIAHALANLQRHMEEAVRVLSVGEQLIFKAPQVGVFVLHNVIQPVKYDIGDDLLAHRYFAPGFVHPWMTPVYPWELGGGSSHFNNCLAPQNEDELLWSHLADPDHSDNDDDESLSQSSAVRWFKELQHQPPGPEGNGQKPKNSHAAEAAAANAPPSLPMGPGQGHDHQGRPELWTTRLEKAIQSTLHLSRRHRASRSSSSSSSGVVERRVSPDHPPPPPPPPGCFLKRSPEGVATEQQDQGRGNQGGAGSRGAVAAEEDVSATATYRHHPPTTNRHMPLPSRSTWQQGADEQETPSRPPGSSLPRPTFAAANPALNHAPPRDLPPPATFHRPVARQSEQAQAVARQQALTKPTSPALTTYIPTRGLLRSRAGGGRAERTGSSSSQGSGSGHRVRQSKGSIATKLRVM